MKTRIAITGASGFIGKHLILALEQENVDVVLLTRNKSKIAHIPEKFTVIECDLLYLDSLKIAFKGVDVVINCAAEVRDFSKIEKTNIDGTNKLIEALEFCQVKKLIHLSSIGVIGANYSLSELKLNEESACKPTNLYEKTKLKSENLILAAGKKNLFETIIIRPTNVFGENHPFNAILNLIQHIKLKKTILLTKKARVNYVYVKDLTAVLVHFIDAKSDEKILNVGESQDLSNFLALIAKNLECELKLIFLPNFVLKCLNFLKVNKLNAVSNGIVHADNKIKTLCNYPYRNENGIQRTINFYKENQFLK